MKSTNNIQNNKKNTPIKLMGSVFAASLIMFGAASCSSEGESYNEDPLDESTEVALDNEYGYTTDPVRNSEVNYFEDWDTNRDRQWSKEEFTAGMDKHRMYEEWDSSNDGLIEERELQTGLFNTWDTDSNNNLDHGEFTAAYAGINYNAGMGEFEKWDTNKNSQLDADEFSKGVANTEIYSNWDTDGDGMYSEDELYTGLFDSWDRDNDGYLAQNEYNGIGFDNWGL